MYNNKHFIVPYSRKTRSGQYQTCQINESFSVSPINVTFHHSYLPCQNKLESILTTSFCNVWLISSILLVSIVYQHRQLCTVSKCVTCCDCGEKINMLLTIDQSNHWCPDTKNSVKFCGSFNGVPNTGGVDKTSDFKEGAISLKLLKILANNTYVSVPSRSSHHLHRN